MRRARATALLVLVRELLDAEDGDDVLQVPVALEDGLHAAGGVVVVLADEARVEDAGERGQRVHGRVERLLDQRAVQRDHGVEVAEGGDDAGVGVVVRGDVDRLERVIEPRFVEVMRSSRAPMSVASVGW